MSTSSEPAGAEPASVGSPEPVPLVAESVVKVYQQGTHTVRALDGVSLRAAQGELVAIMGASGSGKSTLLHALSGLTDIDGGRVVVAGHDLAQPSDAALTRFRRQHIGLVFQAFNLLPTLSAEDNIRLPAMGEVGLDAAVERLLERFGLLARRSHRPAALSSGEQQRVAIARALITNPAIVLADEPTGSLDSASSDLICQLLRELATHEQRTIVVVTHEPAVAMWADRVVILADGARVGEFQPAGDHDPQAISRAYQDLLKGRAEATP